VGVVIGVVVGVVVGVIEGVVVGVIEGVVVGVVVGVEGEFVIDVSAPKRLPNGSGDSVPRVDGAVGEVGCPNVDGAVGCPNVDVVGEVG
jgi:hypothetical protein